MQVQLDIPFDQLLSIVKKLPAGQRKLLKAALTEESKNGKPNSVFENLLLNGPTATKKQLEVINKNRKAINQWRTK